MCTDLLLRTKDGNYLFGRNIDLEYNFNQSVYLVPRNFAYKNVLTGKIENGINGVSYFFHMLNNVAMSNYFVVTSEGINGITQYTSCMCQNSCIYYYNNYNNSRINAVDMNKENLDSNEIKNFSYFDEMDINYQN